MTQENPRALEDAIIDNVDAIDRAKKLAAQLMTHPEWVDIATRLQEGDSQGEIAQDKGTQRQNISQKVQRIKSFMEVIYEREI